MEQTSHQAASQEAPVSLCWASLHGSPRGSYGPQLPTPHPQGPGGLHSPVFHDTAHVVDGAVAPGVGAQEVAHAEGTRAIRWADTSPRP